MMVFHRINHNPDMLQATWLIAALWCSTSFGISLHGEQEVDKTTLLKIFRPTKCFPYIPYNSILLLLIVVVILLLLLLLLKLKHYNTKKVVWICDSSVWVPLLLQFYLSFNMKYHFCCVDVHMLTVWIDSFLKDEGL